MNIKTEKWIEVDGSIYTEKVFQKISEFTGRPMQNWQRVAVAFNVGKNVAQHIVAMHNFYLESGKI